MRVRYTGEAGYEFHPIGGAPFAPSPGDVLDLDEDLVATLGDQFHPVDEPSGVPDGTPDLSKTPKRGLIKIAEANGIDVDPSAPVEEIRAVVTAALDTSAPADVDHTPTGQED